MGNAKRYNIQQGQGLKILYIIPSPNNMAVTARTA